MKILLKRLNDWSRDRPILVKALFWCGLTLLILIIFSFLVLKFSFFQVKKQPIGIVTTTNYCMGIITASGVKVKEGHIALSHDIVTKYGLKFGDLIYIEGETEPYIFTDRMPHKWRRHADIYLRNCKEAWKYGVKERRLWFVRRHSEKD